MTIHVSAADVRLSGSYEPVGDVLYLSAPGDDKAAPAQETPEGHALRFDAVGRITHVTAINARWLLGRDGQLVATLRDGRSLRIDAVALADVALSPCGRPSGPFIPSQAVTSGRGRCPACRAIRLARVLLSTLQSSTLPLLSQGAIGPYARCGCAPIRSLMARSRNLEAARR